MLEDHNRQTIYPYNVDPKILEKAREKFKEMSDKQKKELTESLGWFFLTDSIKKKIRCEIQANMKKMDIISLLLAAIGFATNALGSYFYIYFHKTSEHDTFSILVTGLDTPIVQLLRCITTFTTVILLTFIVLHYRTRLFFLIFKQRVELASTLFSTKLIYPMVIELFICAIHSPPMMNNVMVSISTTGSNPKPIDVDVDLIFSIIVPCRVYLLFRFYSLYSDWTDDRAEKICHESNTTGGMRFAVKATLKDRPYLAVTFLMVLSIFIFGYMIRNIEIAFMRDMTLNKFQDWRYIWNGFWCIIITVLTVGYGDYYPQTHLGRFIAVIACLWGTFLISLMVVSLTNSVDFTPQEEKAYEEIKRERMQKELKQKALKLIKLFYDAKDIIEKNEDLSDRENSEELENQKKLLSMLKNEIKEFRDLRKKAYLVDNDSSIESVLNKINKSINDDMEELISWSQINATKLVEHVKFSKNCQNTITTYVSTLERLTKGLHECIKNQPLERPNIISSDKYIPRRRDMEDNKSYNEIKIIK